MCESQVSNLRSNFLERNPHQSKPECQSESESRLVVSDFLRPQGLYSPWNTPGQNTGVGSLSFLQGIFPNPGIEPRSSALQADAFPAEPQRKPKNTGVGSISLLQWISLTQELNQGLLHCRQILYQLNYQGSPNGTVVWLLKRIFLFLGITHQNINK